MPRRRVAARRADDHVARGLSNERLGFIQGRLAEAQSHVLSGRADVALRVLKPLERECARMEPFAALLAAAEHETGSSERAYARLWPLVRARDAAQNTLFLCGRVCQRTARHEEALEAFRRAHAAGPGEPRCAAVLASVLNTAGEHEEALRVARREACAPAPPEDALLRTHAARALLRLGREGEARAELELARSPAAPGPARRGAGFVESEILAAAGDHAGAFDAAGRARAIEPGAFDPDAFDDSVGRVVRAFSREAMASLPRASARNDRATLIVGMPRSGTTLVESILDRHPSVHAGGELAEIPLSVHRAGGALAPGGVSLLTDAGALSRAFVETEAGVYAERLKALSRRARFVTDKMPHNVLHLGLAELLAPGARVIRCLRDPRDVAVSLWTTPFRGHHTYADSLEGIGRYMLGVRRLAEHWASVLSLPILEVEYEALVAEPRAQAERILAFLDLEWRDECLSFHEGGRRAWTASSEQVRRPVSTGSVGRWRRHEAQLAPLLGVIGDLRRV